MAFKIILSLIGKGIVDMVIVNDVTGTSPKVTV